MGLAATLFHEPWWLSAVTGDCYDEATVRQGDRLVGRLPFVVTRRGPFQISTMPAFTHLLGPIIDAGVGKAQSQLARRLSIARDLVDQLPAFAYFKQVFDPTVADGLAMLDGLAFQDRGFRIATQYTFRVDPLDRLESIWEGMHTTVRQHIRRAQDRYKVLSVDDPDRFIRFYLENIAKLNRRNRTDFSHFINVFRQCQTRNCGEILGAVDPNGTWGAMTFLVWAHGTMYYLLSTRAPDAGDRGSVNLLLWSALRRAHELKIKFDFDGVYSNGSARFLSGFGGKIGVRLIVTRAKPIYGMLQFVKTTLKPSGTEDFT